MSEMEEKLLRYLVARDKDRADRAKTFLDGLTAREQWLVHDAAVMGWVLGARSVPGAVLHAEIPADSVIIQSVVQHCQTTSDRFPVIGEDIRALVIAIVRQNHQPPVPAVARTVADLARVEEQRVAEVIDDMVSDELLLVTDGWLSQAEPETDDPDETHAS